MSNDNEKLRKLAIELSKCGADQYTPKIGVDIENDPIDDLIDQFCYWKGYELLWKKEAFYELTEVELNVLLDRVYTEEAVTIKIDHKIMFHIAKKVIDG